MLDLFFLLIVLPFVIVTATLAVARRFSNPSPEALRRTALWGFALFGIPSIYVVSVADRILLSANSVDEEIQRYKSIRKLGWCGVSLFVILIVCSPYLIFLLIGIKDLISFRLGLL